MSGQIIDEQNFYDIANAIRRKNGKTTLYRPRDMGPAISEISSDIILDPIIDSIIDGSITRLESNDITSIGEYVLYYCENLEYLSLPNCTSLGKGVFSDCKNLVSVNLPLITDLDNEVSIYSVFSSCTSLTTVNLPLCEKIGYTTFYECTSLEEVTFPKVISINLGAFENCTSLTTVNLPVCQSIGGTAFYKCSSLTSVTLGYTGGVVSIEEYSTFTDTPLDDGEGHIYVPANLVDAYKASSNWDKFVNLITAIS